MLPDDTIRVARQLISVAFKDRDDDFRRELQIAMNELSARGQRNTGYRFERIQELASHEVKIRAELALRLITDAIVTTREQVSPDDVGAAIKAEVAAHFPPHLSSLRQLVIDATATSIDLESVRQRAIERANAHVDLLVTRLKAPLAPSAGGSTVVNIHAAVGAVLTGASASASTIQVVGASERTAAVDALTELRARVAALEE